MGMCAPACVCVRGEGRGRYLGVGRLRDLPEVVLGAGGDAAEEDLLGHAAPQHHAHPVEELLPTVQVLLPGQVLSVTQTLPPRDD